MRTTTRTRTANTILVPIESYMFLTKKERMDTAGITLSEASLRHVARQFNSFARNGLYKLRDGAFKLSCEDMKRILDDAGLTYEDNGVETEEYIAIGF